MNGAQTGIHQAGEDGPAKESRPEAVGNAEPSLASRFVCADPASKALDAEIAALAARQTTALIVGESGVGKERVAREIHDRSPRAKGPFLAVDCSSFSGTLIESQLFGHVQGAFTGAENDSPGYIRAADGGTLFLDEVGDMPLPLQTRLLRVLQERCVTPVGQTEPVPVDVRIVAATHRHLPLLAKAGEFREDLFYRLSVYRLFIPPLRERIGDVVPLANHFLQLQAVIYEEPCRRLSAEARGWLEAQPWRGNVRELGNTVEYALVTSDHAELTPEDFPEPILSEQEIFMDLDDPARLSEILPPSTGVLTLRDAEWRAVVAALRATGGDKTQASKLLKVSRSRLYSILARQGRPGDSSSTRSAS